MNEFVEYDVVLVGSKLNVESRIRGSGERNVVNESGIFSGVRWAPAAEALEEKPVRAPT